MSSASSDAVAVTAAAGSSNAASRSPTDADRAPRAADRAPRAADRASRAADRASTDEGGHPRPRLRGWIHALAAPGALVVATLMWRAAAPGWPRLSVAVFGAALVGLYATSGLYHVPRWSQRVRHWWSRADVAMIQLFIAASFTPIAVHGLTGLWRLWSLVIVWVIGVIGAVVAASPIKGPRWLSVVGYTSFASLALVPLVRIVGVFPRTGLVLIVASAALYVLGGVVYARRQPNPWPRWFGFHEVFHVLVVAAGATHVVALWEYTIPLA